MTAKPRNYISNKEMLEEIVVYQTAHRRAVKSGEEPPRCPDKIGKMIVLICTRLSDRWNFVGYCVDRDTEILTKRGWLDADSVNERDSVLSVRDGKLVWSSLRSIYRAHRSGPMHRLTCRGIDALVTPNHKFLTDSGLKRVEDLLATDRIMLTGDPAPDGAGQYPDELVELIGWAITEGHYEERHGARKTTTRVVLSQNPGRKADRIDAALRSWYLANPETGDGRWATRELPYGRHVRKDRDGHVSWVISGRLAETIHELAPDRVPTMDFVLSLTQQQRLLLISTMVDADGHRHVNGGMMYTQRSQENMDAFLALATIAGQTVSYRRCEDVRTPFGVTSWTNAYVYREPKRYCVGQNIDFHGGFSRSGNVPTEPYDGQVWCVETEHGSFMCRRNGYVYLTGNSYKDEMIAEGALNCSSAVLKFNPRKSSNPHAYFTTIAFNSFRKIIGKEQRQNAIKHVNLDHMNLFDEEMMPANSTSVSPSKSDGLQRHYEVIERFERTLSDKKKKLTRKKAAAKKESATKPGGKRT